MDKLNDTYKTQYVKIETFILNFVKDSLLNT